MLNFTDPEIFREVLDHLPTAVYFVDPEEKIRYWNEGAERITGYLRQDVVGHFCRENILSSKSAHPPASERLPGEGETDCPAQKSGSPPNGEAQTPFQTALRDGRV